MKALRRLNDPTAWFRRRDCLLGVPRGCRKHAGDDRELGVHVLGVGPGEDGGDRSGFGSPLCGGHLGVALRVPSREGCGSSELSHDCAAPRRLPRTRWDTQTMGFRPSVRSIATASFAPASGLAGLPPSTDESSLFPGTCRPRTSAWKRAGSHAHGLPCKPFGLTLGCCQPMVWDVPDQGVLRFSWGGSSSGLSLRRCRRPPSSAIVGPEFACGTPRPITARFTPLPGETRSTACPRTISLEAFATITP